LVRFAVKNARSTTKNAAAPPAATHSGLCQSTRTTTKKRIVSMASVPVTAIPYADASFCEEPKPITSASTAAMIPQLTAGT
jgi:hypothetical protein